MKREMLKGIWEDAAEKFENSFAPDILGYWYSRYCGGEMIDLKEVLEDPEIWKMVQKFEQTSEEAAQSSQYPSLSPSV